MSRPRVLIFSLAYLPFVGGAEVAVKELTDRLGDQYDFELITLDLDGRQKTEEFVGKVRVFRTPAGWSKKSFFPFAALRVATRRHRSNPYSLVWAIMASQGGMAAALFKKRFRDIPFLLTLQEGDDLSSLSYRLKLLAPRMFGVFRLADSVQVISNYLGDWARKMGVTCPVTVVPNGVDEKKFQAKKLTERQIKNSQIIITTSRLVKKNGIDTLIESLKFLPDNVHLQILGTGQEETALKKLVSRFDLDKRIKFLGQVLVSEIFNYLVEADVFARPSRSEGLGNSFLEAMAAGLPVIGTSVGGIPDFLKDGQTGWLCRVDDPKDLADKISFILNRQNREKVQQVVKNGQKLVSERYNWKRVSGELEEILAKLSQDR